MASNELRELNGWYYVVPKKGMPFIQERVDHMVQENFATILANGEYVERICGVHEVIKSPRGIFLGESVKPKLVTPFEVELYGEIVFTLTEPIMVAKVTAQTLLQP